MHVTEGQRERERVRACVRFALAGLSTQTRSFVCFCSVVLLFEIAFLISGLLSAGFEAGKPRNLCGEKREGTRGKRGKREREREMTS